MQGIENDRIDTALWETKFYSFDE